MDTLLSALLFSVVLGCAGGCGGSPAATADFAFDPDASMRIADASMQISDASSDLTTAADAAMKGLAFTPWMLIDAENGTVGQMDEGSASDQWTDSDGNTTVDTTYVYEGAKSFKLHANKGTPNNGGEFGLWGARKALPSPGLGKGDVVHVQVALYLPTTFDWTANPWLKFLRLHTATAYNGSNVGYNDIYIYNQKATPGQDGQLNSIYEGAQVWKSSTAVLTKGSWQLVEIEVTFDDTSVDNGGMARTRLWHLENGEMKLTLDRTDSTTLVSATDVVDGFFLFTYWNSGSEDGTYPSQAQDAWVDRVVLEKDLSKLVETDAAGNKIIGGAL